MRPSIVMNTFHSYIFRAKLSIRHIYPIREQTRWVSCSSLLREKCHQNQQEVQKSVSSERYLHLLEKYTINLIAHSLHLPSRFFWPLPRGTLDKFITQQDDESYVENKNHTQEKGKEKFSYRLAECTWTPVEIASHGKLAVVSDLRRADASSSLPTLKSTRKIDASISSNMELEFDKQHLTEDMREEENKLDGHLVNNNVYKNETTFVDKNNVDDSQCKNYKKKEEHICNTLDCCTTTKLNLHNVTESKEPDCMKSSACKVMNTRTNNGKQTCENNDNTNAIFTGKDGGGIFHSSLIESYTLLLHTVFTQAMYQHGESRWLSYEQKCSASNTSLIKHDNKVNNVTMTGNANVRNSCTSSTTSSSSSSSSSVLGRHAHAAERRLRGRLVIYASEQVEPTLLEIAKMMCIGHIRIAQTIQGISTIESNANGNDEDEDSTKSDECMRNATLADEGKKVHVKRVEPTLSAFRWTLSSLQSTVAEDLAHGLIPCLVIGVFGSHLCGAVDELKQIGEWCRKVNIWFHIDASYGAMALLGMNSLDAQSPSLVEAYKSNSHKLRQKEQNGKIQGANAIDYANQNMHEQTTTTTKRKKGIEHFKYAQRHLERTALEFSAGAACADSIIILLSHPFFNVHSLLPRVRYADLLSSKSSYINSSYPSCVPHNSTCASMLFASHVAKFTAARQMLINTKVQRTHYCKISPTRSTLQSNNENIDNRNNAYAMLQLASPNVWESSITSTLQSITSFVSYSDTNVEMANFPLGEELKEEKQEEEEGGIIENICSSTSNNMVRYLAETSAYMNKVSYRVCWLQCCLRAMHRAIQADGMFDASMQTTCFGFILFRYLMCSDETTELLALTWRERLRQNSFVYNTPMSSLSSSHNTNQMSTNQSWYEEKEEEEEQQWWRQCQSCVSVHVGITVLQKRSWVHLHLSIAPTVNLSFHDVDIKSTCNSEFRKAVNTINSDDNVINNNSDNDVHVQCTNANETHLSINDVVKFVMSQLRQVTTIRTTQTN